MMINTELHNRLIEEESQRKVIEAQRIKQITKNRLLKEKLKAILLIMGVVFIGLLLLIFLYWIFPVKSKSTAIQSGKITKIVQQKIKELGCCKQRNKDINATNTKIQTHIHNQIPKTKNSTKLKDGVDYVKENNHIYKRVWKNGELVLQEELEESIDESRKKHHEKIPQFAAPKR